ncbi:MAG: cobD [Frankiales bacterium]|nr:cobD [Frankiales bacterium]
MNAVPHTALIVGVGIRYGTTAAELGSLLDAALAVAGLPRVSVTALATVAERANDPAVMSLASQLDVPILAHSAERLATVRVPNPSHRVRTAVNTASVAEAAALLGAPEPDPLQFRLRLRIPELRPATTEAEVELVVPKTSSTRATIAIARHSVVDLHHHGDRELAADLLDLAVNVRTEPQPSWLREAIAGATVDLAAYPDPRPATEAVASNYRVESGQVLITAGAAEAFTLIARARPPGHAVIVHPQFTEPEVALRRAGWRITRVLLHQDRGFRLDPSRIPEDADLLVIGNPTNPTGVLHTAAELRALRRPHRLLVVDEAFMDSLRREPESLLSEKSWGALADALVVRSLTKTWGLAGLRVGYVVGDGQHVAKLAAVQARWSVSTPALAATLACFTPAGSKEADQRARRSIADAAYLRSALHDRGFELVPDAVGPFVLTRHPYWPTIHPDLRSAGIAVRQADTFPGLDFGWIRVAARSAEATATLLAAIDAKLAT